MDEHQSSEIGVQQLIDRLHQEGVDRGRADAESLLAEARKEAAAILDDAQRQAADIRRNAQNDAEQLRTKGEAAVRLAGRDAILSLTEELRAGFERTLHRFVDQALCDPAFLRQLLLQIAASATRVDQDSELIIQLLGQDEDQVQLGSSEADEKLNELARSLASQSLRDGLRFEVIDSDVPGVRVQVVDQQLEIDLTTDTLTHLLLKHLTPRIRAIVGQ